MQQDIKRPAPLGLVLAAFAAIYVIWGSTYLAIHFAIQALPPFLMAGCRFLLAGSLLYGWARLRGGPRATRKDWRDAAIVGGLLFLGGNGLVVWAQQMVPSGLTALIIATEPLWIVILVAATGGARPGWRAILGLLAGFAGMALLMTPGIGGAHVKAAGAVALLLAALSWAIGSVYSQAVGARAQAAGVGAVRHAFLWTGMQMLCGGAMQLLTGLARGEAAAFDPASVTLSSVLAFLYLLSFGSIIGFTAYSWLLSVRSAAAVSTYAYVNPVVAVVLGWLIGDETLDGRTIIAAVVIIGGVALILRSQQKDARRARARSIAAEPARAEAA